MALMVFVAFIVTVHVPVPEQPLNVVSSGDGLYQPTKDSPLCAVAVSVTSVSASYVTQSLPKMAQLDVTLPSATERETLLLLNAGRSSVTVRL
jgi:hypothetical protein